MKKSRIALLLVLICGIAVALWWGFHPEPPPPTITVRLLSLTNSPSATTSAIFVVSNTCDRNVRVFGPLSIEFRPPPLVPTRHLRDAPPVTLAPHQAASYQVSPMPTQTWRTEFNCGYWTIDDPGIWAKVPQRFRVWLLAKGVKVGGTSIAPYHRYSEWIAP
jgi:hypothetical protein